MPFLTSFLTIKAWRYITLLLYIIIFASLLLLIHLWSVNKMLLLAQRCNWRWTNLMILIVCFDCWQLWLIKQWYIFDTTTSTHNAWPPLGLNHFPAVHEPQIICVLNRFAKQTFKGKLFGLTCFSFFHWAFHWALLL